MRTFFFYLFLAGVQGAQSQTQLYINVPVVDLPQNSKSDHSYPSMQQALSWSNNFYELSYWGLDALGQRMFRKQERPMMQSSFNYLTGFLFSRYGSELPIPLGVWGHEEYHCAVLGVNSIQSNNGNWILRRWDGTVYGPSDQELADFKATNPESLLYSYVAGVQYQTQLTKVDALQDFYQERTFYKNPLYLFNAYYVWNYFRFSTSKASDSVKVIAPKYESSNSRGRDFAGADLTAWAYDMFSPGASYFDRDDFPNGTGENRRVGFHDLTPEGRHFLQRQKHLALLNFINPAIYLINRIKVGEGCYVLPFMQYQPTSFGNAISLNVPVRSSRLGYFVGISQYNALRHSYGFQLGMNQIGVSSWTKIQAFWDLNVWNQPQSYFSSKENRGGALQCGIEYSISDSFHLMVKMTGKTIGWMEGNPYLKSNFSQQLALNYQLHK